MQPQTTKGIAVFEQHGIRRTWHDDRWFFSVVDVISVFVGTTRARKYWVDLKGKLRAEGAELSLEIGQLKLPGKDGKFYNTDCADTATMLRLIQSVPSPKAEPFKQWLAQVGTERIAEAEDPEAAFEEWRKRAIASYVAHGYNQQWAEKRVEVIVTRNQLTREWVLRGITPEEIPVLTDELHMGSFGVSTEDHKGVKDYPVTWEGKHIGDLRNGMVMSELVLASLSSVLAVEEHQRNDSHGIVEIRRDINVAARATAAARKAIEEVTGHPVVSPINAMPQANTLWAQLPESDKAE